MIKYRVIYENAMEYPTIQDFEDKDYARICYAKFVTRMFEGEEFDNDDRNYIECIDDTETAMYDEKVKVFEVWDDEVQPLYSWN